MPFRMVLLLLLASCPDAPGLAAGQWPQAAWWLAAGDAHRGNRADEAQEPAEPPQRSGLDDWMRRARRAVGDEGDGSTRGFFPLFGVVVAGSSVAAGVGYRDYRLLGSPLGFEVSGMLSLRRYQVYRAHLGLLGPHRYTTDLRPADAPLGSMVDDGTRNRRGVSAYLDARYRYYPRQRFWGVGPRSAADDRTDYLLKGGSYDLVLQAQPASVFGVSARAGLLESRLGEGRDDDWPSTQERFASREAPGLGRPPRYLVAGVGADLDTRDNPGDPRAGLFLAAVAWRFDARSNDRFDFARIALDARTYLAPGSSPGVLALRGLVSTDLTPAGGEVPFFLQQTLGGQELLRSWEGSRYRDRSVMYATVEYRWHPHELVEVTPFLDLGAVGPRLAALRVSDVKVSLGIGVRPTWKQRVLGRMEFAWGREGRRLLFAVGPVF